MKAKSKWLAIFLVLGLILAACGGDGGGEDETTTTEGSTDTTEDMTTTTEGSTDTTGGEGPMDIATDVGVDLEAGTIKVGLLSDLSGVFSSLVQVIVTGQEVYWENVNANGGIGGLQVELMPLDTVYDIPTTVQRYEELREEVVAIGHSTGSPHTVAVNEMLQEDGMLAIPLTWYSGWSDDAINSNLVHHGVPYCLEAMNVFGYVSDSMDISTVAIASNPGDYGLDSHAGAVAAAEALGLEVVYEAEGAINAADEATLTEVANGIAGSGADFAFVTTSPGAFSSIFGQALAQGYQGVWSGAGPSYNPAFIAPDSPIKDPIAASTYWSSYYNLWGMDTPGIQEATQLLMDSGRVEQPISAYFEGFVEASIMHAALQQAYDNGDMTRAGVLAAAKSLEEVDLNGLGPNEVFVGSNNDQVQRTSATIWQPDPEALASGESAGEAVLETDYTHPITEAYEFTSACYSLEG
ncbi:MAG TPA: ABC transporter substrate-binding protein [Acidimicrobiia bacterium]|nr:ABC transporter substrate-binding protein [Acidimicrobiia bacterium]